jgi:hypothetical protein
MFQGSAMSTNLTLATGVRPHRTTFVLVNNRIPRTGEHCALCGGIVEQGYVPDSQTRARSEEWRLTMNTNPVLWIQAYIIGVLVILISITAITEHPEWFN